jgi:hypothetical protein
MVPPAYGLVYDGRVALAVGGVGSLGRLGGLWSQADIPGDHLMLSPARGDRR